VREPPFSRLFAETGSGQTQGNAKKDALSAGTPPGSNYSNVTVVALEECKVIFDLGLW
jgi:hypothetical protein